MKQRMCFFDDYLFSLTNVPSFNRYFVHVRLGDYLHWPSVQSPAALPFDWYVEALQHISQRDPYAHFVFFSDDSSLRSSFSCMDFGVTFLSSSVYDDFTAMLCCQAGGVLSASSLSYWAAALLRSDFPHASFLAPLYWLGWSSGNWQPYGSFKNWITYLPVKSTTSFVV
jgi:hypothetical protein